jgi:hypothetical protein
MPGSPVAHTAGCQITSQSHVVHVLSGLTPLVLLLFLQPLMHSWATVQPWRLPQSLPGARMLVMHSLLAWASGCLPTVLTRGSAGCWLASTARVSQGLDSKYVHNILSAIMIFPVYLAATHG